MPTVSKEVNGVKFTRHPGRTDGEPAEWTPGKAAGPTTRYLVTPDDGTNPEVVAVPDPSTENAALNVWRRLNGFAFGRATAKKLGGPAPGPEPEPVPEA